MESKQYLVTKFGEVKVTPTSGSHIYVSSDTGENQIVVNSIAYSLSAHLYKKEDGTWSFVTEMGNNAQPYMTRRNAFLEGKKPDPRPEARRKVKEELIRAITEWAKTHEYSLRDAHIDNLRDLAKRAAERVSEAGQALADAHKEWSAAQQAYLEASKQAA